MKTQWNNRQGSRNCQAVCWLVSADGSIHPFSGESIPGICHATIVDGKKDGKWSFSVWEITHAETTALVQWHQDWEQSLTFPQSTWTGGYLWLAEKAPLADRAAFETLIRTRLPKTAERWDAAAGAEAEFGRPADPAMLVRIAARRAEIAVEIAAMKEIDRVSEELARERERLAADEARLAAAKADRAAGRHSPFAGIGDMLRK
ncbi:MAG: hypothetical protein Q7R58_01400 [bacterium]|nr:hypothetical protein [bacterium]